jgi:hypothetical protein
MKIAKVKGWSGRRARLRDLLCSGVFILTALVAGAAQARQQAAQSQEAQPQTKTEQGSTPKISVDVKTVSVPVTVHDKHGKIISNLTKEDFVVEEDGRPQTVNYFAREKDLPLRLGLLVDTSLSQRRVLGEERSASYSFLDHLLRENKDLAFVIHFDREVELLEDFTGSRPKLQAALQSLQTPQTAAQFRAAGKVVEAEDKAVELVAAGSVEEELAEGGAEAVVAEEVRDTAAGRCFTTRCIWRVTI